jgi:SAM-dependent methyltransferase
MPASVFSQSLLLTELDAVRQHVTGRTLDVGCGAKPYAWIFGDRISEHIGIDWSPREGNHARVEAYSDAQCLPFGDATFDTVLCTEVMEHLRRPADCMAEIARVLRPGGKAIITTPFMHWLHEEPHDYFRFTPFSLEDMARAAGFTTVVMQTRGNVPAVLLDLWGRWVLSTTKKVGRLGWPARVLSGIVGTLFVSLPQQSYLLHHRKKRKAEARDWAMSRKAALGYVMVVEKPSR